MIRGIIFDFDGLIVDTEWPVYQSWLEIFDSYEAELPLDQWTSIIGVSSHEHFDPFELIEQQTGHPLDRSNLGPKRFDRELELAYAQPILPGVKETITAAKMLNLKLGVASSSDRDWVEGHLARIDLLKYFQVVHTADDVEQAKPDPALFILALQSLGLSPTEAIVLEDSPNGVRAAKDAGIFTVAVPNPLTINLNLDRADLILGSLADMSLADIIQVAEKK
jgi:HAD superfamily hydrolase (TIGR01509 family)